ncbi:MAG TPA: prephenate dehydrogenase [Mycobacteriales bacterium]|nr:prephenate dehydrogenase [Mycobacteriales bacterium]
MSSPAVKLRRVLVVGCGLIGTSVGLALRADGVEVALDDQDPEALALATELGAGEPHGGPAVDLALAAVPPKAVAAVLLRLQRLNISATFTDVASVKAYPLREAEMMGCDLGSYVGSHPIAGRERGGAAAARADLFAGRPWVVCPHREARPDVIEAVRELAARCGSNVHVLDVDAHDRGLALVSHLPQLVASALAADLVTAPTDLLDLAGTGLRDLVRIAASDAALWAQIVSTNATAVAEDLGRLLRRLQSVATALGGLDAGAAATAALIQEGNAGYSRLPGKHGSREPDRFAVVSVVVADRPGELARLLTDAGTAGINIEDLAMEHAPGLPVGVAELFTDPAGAARLRAHLRAGGWSVSG